VAQRVWTGPKLKFMCGTIMFFQRQFGEMLAAGGKPTLTLVMLTITMLMDGCYRVDSLDSTQGVWREIVDASVRPRRATSLRSGASCVSLVLCVHRGPRQEQAASVVSGRVTDG